VFFSFGVDFIRLLTCFLLIGLIRWMPTQTVATIMLSVISLLNAPNFSSPANVDSSVEWRKNPEVRFCFLPV
jgi:ubiquitin-protein ligase